MPEPDTFDPTHALDGWRAPAPAPLQDLDFASLLESGSLRAGDSGARLLRAQPDGFDPTHLLDGWSPPKPAPLDLELRSQMRGGGAGPDEAKKARLKARGFEMLDVEDIELTEAPTPRVVVESWVPPVSTEPLEKSQWPTFLAEAEVLESESPPLAESVSPPHAAQVPVPDLSDIELPQVPPPFTEVQAPELDFRAVPPPVEPDPQQVIADIELPEVARPPVATEAPELDVQVLMACDQPDPRLLTAWQPLAWTALMRRVSAAGAEVLQTTAGPQVQSHAPQWLCALWSPQDEQPALLGRWPDMAALVGGEVSTDALQALLSELPAGAPLWLADREADWGLVAELVLRQQDDLRPAQVSALRELVESERIACLDRMAAGYQTRDGVARRKS